MVPARQRTGKTGKVAKTGKAAKTAGTAKPPKSSAAAKAARTAATTAAARAGKKLTRPEAKKFRKLLDEKRQEIIRNAQKTLGDSMQLDAADLPDDMDLASSEYLQYFTFRLRGREKTYLEKIEKALARIDEGTFGLCEECGEFIGVERLTVRPEATLCIRCKEAQERDERQFG